MTEHTDERSLAHYLSDPSAAEKRNHSAILITAVAGECSPVVSKKNPTTKNVVTQNVAEGDTIDTNDMPFHIINHGTINITVNK